MGSKYDIDAIRKKLKESKGRIDPFEFRPPKAKDDETLKYRFFILPPIATGDPINGGAASKSMDLFFVQNGYHFYGNKRYECPRVHDGEECPICSIGFDLLNDEQDKKRRSAIASRFLARSAYAMNIYFPKDEVNPPNVAGKVMWFNASKTVYDLLDRCLMSDDAGDPADPQPHGIFFDEMGAYLFQLEVSKKGTWNNYDKSKFLVGFGKRPIARNKAGEAITDRIQEILAQRHDLFSKFAPRNREELDEVAKRIINDDDGDENNGDDAGFDETESQPSRPKTQPRSTAKAAATNTEEVETIAEEVDSEVETAPSEETGGEEADVVDALEGADDIDEMMRELGD